MKKMFTILFIVYVFFLLTSVSFAAGPITDKDYVVASLNLDDNIGTVKSVVGKLIYISSYTNEIAACKVNVYGVQGLRLNIAMYGGNESSLWSIELVSPKYSTSRGITVGSGAKKITEKYGEPGYKDTYKDENTGKEYLYWSYEDTNTMRRIIFKIDKVKNVVTSITIARIID